MKLLVILGLKGESMYLKIFDKLNRKCHFIRIIGIVVLTGVWVFFFLESGNYILNSTGLTILLLFLLISIWSICVEWIFQRIAGRNITEITKKTTRKCDIKSAIRIDEALLRKQGPHKDLTARTFLLINLASAYLLSGNVLMAKKKLDAVPAFKKTKDDFLNNVSYHLVLFNYFSQIGEIQKAKAQLEDVEYLLEKGRFSNKLKMMYDNELYYRQMLLKVFEGKGIESEEYFSRIDELSEDTLSKVRTQFTLGEIYYLSGRLSEARRSFEYVVSNGGDTYFVGEAVGYLGRAVDIQK